jgi:hypothetical protein
LSGSDKEELKRLIRESLDRAKTPLRRIASKGARAAAEMLLDVLRSSARTPDSARIRDREQRGDECSAKKAEEHINENKLEQYMQRMKKLNKWRRGVAAPNSEGSSVAVPDN